MIGSHSSRPAARQCVQLLVVGRAAQPVVCHRFELHFVIGCLVRQPLLPPYRSLYSTIELTFSPTFVVLQSSISNMAEENKISKVYIHFYHNGESPGRIKQRGSIEISHHHILLPNRLLGQQVFSTALMAPIYPLKSRFCRRFYASISCQSPPLNIFSPISHVWGLQQLSNNNNLVSSLVVRTKYCFIRSQWCDFFILRYSLPGYVSLAQ
ncbi:unnamed protein product [Citrullus colocynthis]|uniref:Uncharacterized protein n=1 Tax=Citrullus colocynthis TaxID=252529 RepID=A0ABP0YDJ8_9ROSI